MTEQQIKHLQHLLEHDISANNSVELDAEILSVAHKQAAQNACRQARQSFLRPLFKSLLHSSLQSMIRSLRFVPAVSLALVMTLGLLLAMGQWIALDAPSPVAEPSKPGMPFDINSLASNGVQSEPERIVPPQLSTALARPTGTPSERDQVLMIYPLPDTRTVIASMQFALEQERMSASENIQLALNDINQMINQGQLNDARQRYGLLRDQCQYCVLPNSLELLVFNHQTRDGRPPSDTG